MAVSNVPESFPKPSLKDRCQELTARIGLGRVLHNSFVFIKDPHPFFSDTRSEDVLTWMMEFSFSEKPKEWSFTDNALIVDKAFTLMEKAFDSDIGSVSQGIMFEHSFDLLQLAFSKSIVIGEKAKNVPVPDAVRKRMPTSRVVFMAGRACDGDLNINLGKLVVRAEACVTDPDISPAPIRHVTEAVILSKKLGTPEEDFLL